MSVVASSAWTVSTGSQYQSCRPPWKPQRRRSSAARIARSVARVARVKPKTWPDPEVPGQAILGDRPGLGQGRMRRPVGTLDNDRLVDRDAGWIDVIAKRVEATQRIVESLTKDHRGSRHVRATVSVENQSCSLVPCRTARSATGAARTYSLYRFAHSTPCQVFISTGTTLNNQRGWSSVGTMYSGPCGPR